MANNVSDMLFFAGNQMFTFRPDCAILAVEVLAELLNELQQLQVAIGQSCTPVSRVFPAASRLHSRVALFCAT
jgi:hypothetical protein